MREYVVLRGVNDNGWMLEKKVDATSARAAIRALVTEHVGQGHTFVAVPARSWQPVTVTVETKTQLKFQ